MKSIIWICFGSLWLGACGGGISESKHNATLVQLKQCQKENSELAKEQKAQATVLQSERARRGQSEQQLTDLQGNLSATQQDLEEIRKQRAESEKRLREFRDLTEKFQKMIDTGKIQVLIRSGRMIVQLPSGILFPSGKSRLSSTGKTSLGEVADILAQFPDRRFLVAGHTDNAKIRGGKYKSNWELSAAQAVEVTQYLIKKGVIPANLGAAGYGEFDPVVDNSTEEGKQQNRRIEIILVPNISELPQLPNS